DDDLAMARALAVAVPPALLMALLIAALAVGVPTRWPALGGPATDWPLVKLRSTRWIVTLSIVLVIALILGVPLLSLLQKAGAVPPMDVWSAEVAASQTARAWHSQSQRILMSLLGSAVTGASVAVLAWLTCWLLRAERRGRGVLFLGLILLW